MTRSAGFYETNNMVNYLKAILSFCDRPDRWFLVLLLCLMFVSAVIELLGVGSLFPYVKMLSEPKIIHTNHILSSVYQFFHFSTDNHFFIAVGACIFAMILLKGVITLLNNYLQSKFTSGLNNKISERCLRCYMTMRYTTLMRKNSAVLSKHLLYDVQNAVQSITALLQLLTNFLIAITLVALMISADPPLVMMTIGTLGICLYLTVTLTRKRLQALARSTEQNNGVAYQSAGEALMGIKDVKVFGVESYFLNKFMTSRKVISANAVDQNVLANLPTITMNVLGFGILLMILLYLLITRGSLLSVLPVIGLIAICVQRILPTVTVMASSVGMIRNFGPAVFILKDVLASLLKMDADTRCLKNASTDPIRFNRVLTLNHVCYRYPNTKKYALDDISLSIKKHSSLGVVGASGAGKSTLVDVLLGLLDIDKGEIFCDEQNLAGFHPMAIASLVGYVPQQTFLLDGSVKNNIAFGIPDADIDEQALDHAMRVAQLSEFIAVLPEGVNTLIGEKGVKISGGQRQRIGIARALYHDPEILIMDEATNALDAATEKDFNESLVGLMSKKTVVIIAHRLSSVKMCDQLVQLDGGRIVAQGSYAHLSEHSEAFRRIYHLAEANW